MSSYQQRTSKSILARQQFSIEAEAILLSLIHQKFFTRYTFVAFSEYYERDDIALYGFAKIFNLLAEQVITYYGPMSLFRFVLYGASVFAS